MRVFHTILDIVFPVNCISCGKRGQDLCLECLSDLPPTERECAKWVFPLYDYRDPTVRKAVKLLKYNRKRRLASVFAAALRAHLLEELSDLSIMENFKNPILVPVPLSKKRYRERGFNQAELICKNLLTYDAEKNLKMEINVLVKPKETKHQAHIENRTERLKNILGSFAIKNPERITGQNIILIDDVTTTGATLSEAKKILREAGARKVIAFTVAH
jgi:competence protein ComFC